MENKFINFELKASENGEISGYGSVFGNADDGGDIVAKGAFSKSLAAGIAPRMLFQHRPDEVVGVWDEAKEDENGLRVKGRLALGTRRGDELNTLMKMGAIDGLSIGYRTVDAEYDAGSRLIKEAELWEVSVVTFPMNQKARIDAVKAADLSIREFERKLTHDAGFSRSVARALMAGGHTAVKAMQDAGDEGLAELATLLKARR